MKNDPRVRYTEMIIKKAFLEFLQQKPMSKITVREICEKAEINRSTFYKHYLDCYDLMNKLKEEALEQFDTLMAETEGREALPAILSILKAIQSNQVLLSLITQDRGSGEFTHQIVQSCFRYLDLHLPVSPERGWGERQKKMGYAFLTGGVSSVIQYWIQSGCKEPSEQIAAAIMELSEIMVAGLSKQ